MKQARAIFAILIFSAAITVLAQANTTYNLGGTNWVVQLQVVDLQKDAELIGITKSHIEEAARARLQKLKVRIEADGKLPALSVKITTLDVGPRLASHITVELKELGRLSRFNHATFVTSWGKSIMVASEPTKHEAQIIKAMNELIEAYVKFSLQ